MTTYEIKVVYSTGEIRVIRLIDSTSSRAVARAMRFKDFREAETPVEAILVKVV